MKFETLADFIAMGGYGFYVWFCFIFSTILLLGLFIASIKKTTQIKQQIAESVTREKRVKQAKEADLL
jgi:heme exporter protein D